MLALVVGTSVIHFALGRRRLNQLMAGFVPFPKGRDLLRNAIFHDRKIAGLQTSYVIAMTVRDSHVELHQIHHYVNVRIQRHGFLRRDALHQVETQGCTGTQNGDK